MTTEKKLVFIISGGRTGTAFFGERLGGVIDDCFSVHEPDLVAGFDLRTYRRIRQFGWWHVLFGRLLGLTGLRAVGTKYLMGTVSESESQRLIAQFRQRYHASISESLIVESNAQWWYLVDQIPKVWPDAKIIAIIRDPRTWVRSWINKGGRYVKRDRVSFAPPGRLTPGKIGDAKWAKRWDGMDTFGRLVWEWNTVYGNLDRNVRKGETGRIYRFEDLFSADASVMSDLVHFAADHGAVTFPVANLEGFNKAVRNSSSGSARDWPDWVPEQAQLLDEICGPLMRKYGYGDEPEWRAMLTRR